MHTNFQIFDIEMVWQCEKQRQSKSIVHCSVLRCPKYKSTKLPKTIPKRRREREMMITTNMSMIKIESESKSKPKPSNTQNPNEHVFGAVNVVTVCRDDGGVLSPFDLI